MLARIAAETFEKNDYFISQAELETLITQYVKNVPPHDISEVADGEAILKAIEAQHGIFVERAHGIYSFSHLTFQEYFTAKYIVDNAAQGTLKRLVREHCGESRWREVFLLTTSLLPDASDLLTTFRQRLDHLHKDDEKLQEWLTWAEQKSADHSDAHSEFNQVYQSRARALAEALDRSRDRILAKALDQALRDTRSVNARAYLDPRSLNLAEDQARELGIKEVAEELATLAVILEKTTDSDWQEFTNRLVTLIAKHKEIEQKWQLTAIQERQIVEFMRRARLLTDCLYLATMPVEKKKAILNSLYLPYSKEELSCGPVAHS